MRARSHALLLIVTAIALAPLAAARARQARIEDVEQSLIHDPSYRVRVGAALVLGRLGKPRSVPVLVRALSDVNPTVRASAASALGQIGDPSARDPLVRAEQDPNPMVRRMAEKALRQLPQPSRHAPPPPVAEGRRARPAFEVKAMGDHSHRAGPALRQHMRDVLTAELSPVGDVSGPTADPARGYIIDGVIKNLSFAMHPDRVEVTCSVQLVISRQPTGGVFLLTSGEAVVQKPRRHFRTQNRPGMEVEALEGAVRGASEDLRRHLAQQ